MKNLMILLSLLVWLVCSAAESFAGDTERTLTRDLSECGRSVRQMTGKGGALSAADLQRLGVCTEALHADRLLLAERHSDIAQRATAIGGRGAERHDAASSALLTQLDELLSRLDAMISNSSPYDLEELKRLIDTLIPRKSRPLLGALPYKHTNYPPREPASTPIVKPAYKGGDRNVYAADTAASPEAPLSKEIVELAQSLQWNPVLIYEWVKNNVETEWYWGSMKGAEETLRQKSGNDADQASLLVALLRAANFPARYVRGTIDFFPGIERAKDLTGLDDPAKIADFFRKAGIPYKPIISGGGISNFHIEHVWIEAFIPYANYRGAVVDDQGKIWLGLDTSIKPRGYSRSQGVGVPSDLLTTLRDDYLNSVQTLSPLDYLAAKLDEQLAVNQPGTSWPSLKDTAVLIPDVLKIIPDSMQFNQIAVTGEYQALPDELKHKITFSATAGSNELFSITLETHKLSYKKLAIKAEPETIEDQNTIDSYGGLDNTPAYLVRLRPALVLDGERLIVAQDGLPMGADFTLNIDIVTPNGTERISSSHIAGNLSVIGVVAQLSTKSTNDTKIVEDDDAEIILHKEAIGYIDRWNKAEDDLAALLGQRISRPTVSVATVGGQMAVTTLLDIPHDMQWQGLYLDAGYRRIETTGRNGREKEFMRLSALQSSILENRIFEDDLKVDSVSTAKLLQLSATGGTAQVSIDKTNIDTILPNLPFDDAVKQDIANAINQNMTVTIPQNEVAYQHWSGIGYIKENPETGESGWMLSGNVAGGMTAVNKDSWVDQDLANIMMQPSSRRANKDPLAVRKLARITDYLDGTAGETILKPLMVMALDATGRPVKGVPVTFEVIAGGGKIGGRESTTVITGLNGIAKAPFTLGESTSDSPYYVYAVPNSILVGMNLVTVSAPTKTCTIQTDKPIEALGYPGPIAGLVKVAPKLSDGKSGHVNTFSGFVWVKAVDIRGNPISNHKVTFSTGAPVSLHSNPSGSVDLKALLYSEMAECPGIPNRTCTNAKDTIAKDTNALGVYALVILGNTDMTRYPVLATSGGFSQSFDHYSYGIGDRTKPEKRMYYSLNSYYRVDDKGNHINAGKVSTVFPAPLETVLYRNEETGILTDIFTTSPVSDKQVEFTVYSGSASVNPSVANGTADGKYISRLTLGGSPGIIGIKAVAKDADGNGLAGAYSYIDIWSLAAKVAIGQTVYINSYGYPVSDTKIAYSCLPSAYKTTLTYLNFYEDGEYMGFMTGDATSALLSQGGAKFDLEKKYSVELVLNPGSLIEIRSEKVPLNVELNEPEECPLDGGSGSGS